MRHLKTIILAGLILVCAGSVFSAEVASGQARSVVQAWLREDSAPLHARMGQTFSSVETYNDAQNTPLYHVVYLKPAGFVIVSADDQIEPIIAFAEDGYYDPAPDNPLGALISRDLPGRMERVRKQAGPPTNAIKRARNKWTKLQEPKMAASTATNSGTGSTNTISDVRVSPLVQSKWSQLTVGGYACYNYFTPPYTSGASSNYYGGCVATAMAQLMRYYQYPTNSVGTSVFNIYIKGTSATRSLRGRDGSGGAYSWSDMTLVPTGSITDTQRQAIGALISDAGVSVNMDYGDSAYGGSSAYMSHIITALTNTFKYSNVIHAHNNVYTNIGTGLNVMVNPNLDAGCPVLFGITGTNTSGQTVGHAIVCDGYGYNLDTLYHHLNLGWGGNSDAWYALPTIDTTAGYTFTSVDECIYNIYTAGSGEIISGRVTDSTGVPLTNATVTAVRSGGTTYATNTNTRGIYAFPKIPVNSSYTLSVSNNGYVFTNRTVSTGKSSNNSATAGNRWGIDFTAAPLVTLSLSGSPMTEASGTATLTATLSSTYALPVTVNLAFSGAATWTNDYTAASSITIAAGSTTNSIILTAVQDALDESNETIIVDIASVTNGTENGTQQVTAVIEDDDPYPDIDDDGIPDSWELQYYGGTTNADPGAIASNGINTVLEAYIAGLSPVDTSSVFKVNTFSTPDISAGGFVVQWSATSGRVYSVYWMTNLMNSSLPLETNIFWPQASYTDTVHNANPAGFYRINVRVAE